MANGKNSDIALQNRTNYVTTRQIINREQSDDR